MATNFVQPGHLIECELDREAAAGELAVIGSLAGIAMDDVAAHGRGVFAISGVWEVPKKAGEAVTAGQKLYRDASGALTGTASGNSFAGSAFASALASDTTVRLLINGVPSYAL